VSGPPDRLVAHLRQAAGEVWVTIEDTVRHPQEILPRILGRSSPPT